MTRALRFRAAATALAAAHTLAAAGCGGEGQATAAAPTPAPTSLAEAVEGAFRPLVGSGRLVGVVVGVHEGGRRQVFAMGRVSAGGPAPDAATIFEIGSITKPFTAALLAGLAREGRVRLDEPVRELLPDGQGVPSWPGREITLLDLATHTSGLPRLPDDLTTAPGYQETDPYAQYSESLLYAFLARHALRRAPGAAYEYSNLGYGLLGHALVRRLGESFENAIQLRVAGPLGLPDTRVSLTPAQGARLAQGHDERGRAVPPWHLGALEGAGALRSTAADLLAFASAGLGHGPSPAAGDVAAGIPARYTAPDGSVQVGLAWHRLTLAGTGLQVAAHDGGTGGFASYLGLLPERDLALVVLANSATAVADPATGVLAWMVEHPGAP